MLGRGETHVFNYLRDQVVPLMGQSPQDVHCFIKDSEVIGTGVGVAKGWAYDGYIFVW